MNNGRRLSDVSSDEKRQRRCAGPGRPGGLGGTFELSSLILAEAVHPTGGVLCGCGFLSSDGGHLNYWWLGERSGTWHPPPKRERVRVTVHQTSCASRATNQCRGKEGGSRVALPSPW